MQNVVAAPKRVRQVDLAKSIAIFCVILIHTSGEPLLWQKVGSSQWLQSLFWASAARFAVPLFFLCSGALLLDETRALTTGHIWKRNIPHLLAALFFWALVYALVPGEASGSVGQVDVSGAIWDVLCWRHAQHLYFLHIMLLVYAALPVTRLFAAKADEKTVRYALALWAVTGVALPMAKNLGLLAWLQGIPAQWALNMTWSAIGCTVLGWYLRKKPLRAPVAAGMVLLGFVLCFAGTAYLSMQKGSNALQLLEGLSLGPFAMASGVFCLCGAIVEKLPCWLQKAAELGGKSSFCIYLIHQLVLHALYARGLTTQISAPLKSIPLLAALCVAISFVGYFALSRIPFVRRWLI